MKTIKKIILGIVLVSVSVLAQPKETQQAKDKREVSEKRLEYKDFKKHFKFAKAKKVPSILEYVKDTGDTKEHYYEYLRELYKNENWKRATYYMYFATNDKMIMYSAKSSKKVYFPQYPEALEQLSIIVKETKNPLAAYQGMNIILLNYMNTGPTSLAKKYTRIFSHTLAKADSCIGYLFYGRSYMQEFSNSPKYDFAIRIFEQGKKQCIKENTPEYYSKGVLRYLGKAKVMKKVTRAR